MLTISLAQMDIHFGDQDANQAAAAEMIAEASRRGSQLILLPELWSSGYDLTRAEALSAPLGEGLFAWSADQARAQRIAVGGTLLERDGEHFYNTLTLYDQTGALIAAYRKTHLFGLMDEPRYLSAGSQLVTVPAPWGATGLAICYDLRFPELFRHAARQGAALMLIPAEFPAERIDHWSLLLRARAVENLMFVAGANRCGSSPSDQFGGHSALVDPWGVTLAEAGETVALLTVEIDLDGARSARQRLPVLDDRRADLYG